MSRKWKRRRPPGPELEDPIATRVGCLFAVVVLTMFVVGVLAARTALR